MTIILKAYGEMSVTVTEYEILMNEKHLVAITKYIYDCREKVYKVFVFTKAIL